MTRIAIGFTSLVLVLLAGCEAPRALGGQCDLNTHCDYPFVCHLARCRRQCDTIRDCPIGALCVPTNQGYGVCLLPDEMGCAHDSDCVGELVCLDGRCANECTDDSQCAPGARCEGEAAGTRACVDPTTLECTHDSECGDLACVRGRCALECVEDRDCRDGQRCASGACVRYDGGVPIAMDAGAPPPDGGHPPMDGGPGPAVVATCAVASDCRAPGVAGSACTASRCVVTECTGSLADCNAIYEDGCEVDTQTDPLHCGGCDGFCGYGASCSAGTCGGEVVDLDLGEDHLCAAWSNGNVVCMGRNSYGQLGLGYANNDFVTAPDPVIGLSDAVAVSVGIYSSCALRATGEVACWGDNTNGQVGDGRFTRRYTATAVHVVTGAEQIGTGGGFACARTGGDVYCWGGNRYGQLGDGTIETRNEPVQVVGLSDAIDLAVGDEVACAVRATNEVVCWGYDQSGQLGDGPGSPETCTTYPCSTTPTAVSGITDAVDVAAGGRTICVRHTGGSVSCWGNNRDGNLGVGEDAATTPFAEAPRAVTALSNVEQIALASWHTCARHTDGTVSCWGDQYALGDGTSTASTSPVSVLGLTDATHIAVGIARSCALRSSGGPVCWGTNDYGIFGVDGIWSTWDRPMPIPSSFP